MLTWTVKVFSHREISNKEIKEIKTRLPKENEKSVFIVRNTFVDNRASKNRFFSGFLKLFSLCTCTSPPDSRHWSCWRQVGLEKSPAPSEMQFLVSAEAQVFYSSFGQRQDLDFPLVCTFLVWMFPLCSRGGLGLGWGEISQQPPTRPFLTTFLQSKELLVSTAPGEQEGTLPLEGQRVEASSGSE